MRGVAILPACENAPVASSKISALLSALPSSTREKFLTVARPLKPPPSSTWVGESAAAAASARLDVALPVRKNWPDDGSKNSALARLRFDASAPPAINTSPATGMAGLRLTWTAGLPRGGAPESPAADGDPIVSPLMHPLVASRLMSPPTVSAAAAIRTHRGLLMRDIKRARLRSSLYGTIRAPIRRI